MFVPTVHGASRTVRTEARHRGSLLDVEVPFRFGPNSATRTATELLRTSPASRSKYRTDELVLQFIFTPSNPPRIES